MKRRRLRADIGSQRGWYGHIWVNSNPGGGVGGGGEVASSGRGLNGRWVLTERRHLKT